MLYNLQFRTNTVQSNASVPVPLAKTEAPMISKREIIVENPSPVSNVLLISTMPSKPNEENKPTINQQEEKSNGNIYDSESAHIIPWRAQLRKTNSKLNILD
jgi:hypothetical protein